MAKARTKKKSETPSTTSSAAVQSVSVPSRGLEAIGIAMLLAALGLCLSLFSFDPSDASQNLVGPLGARLAGVILGGIGVAGYVVGLLGVGLAGATLFGRVRWPSPLSVISAFGITVGACLLAQLVVGEPEVLGHPAGGVLGLVLSELLRGFAGPAGAALVGVGLVLLGVLGISNLSFSLALQEGFRFMRRTGAGVSGQAKVWAEASKAARQREAELVEAARSQRAQAQLEEDARARDLEGKLEEKKRLAVLKATARAEEKALKKIAALDAKERVEKQAELPEGASTPEAGDAEPAQVELPEAAEPTPAAEPSERPSAADVIEDITPDPEEMALGIPGPAAEPEILIKARAPDEEPTEPFEAQPSADVIEEMDRRSRLPGPADLSDTSTPALDVPYDAVESVESLDAVDEIARATRAPAAKARASTSAPEWTPDGGGLEDEASEADDVSAAAEPVGDELVIHERKACEATFDDEGPHTVEEPAKPIYELPPINLLDYEGEAPDPVDGLLLKQKANRLEEKLKTYGVDGKVTAIRPGPVVTTYEYQPAPGVKVSKIQNLSDDIAMSMEAVRVRIVAPIPGRGVVGIELPNDKRENVYLKEVIAHERFKKSQSLLTLALGKDAEGDVQVRNLQKMPHLLIAGTTGSGKSVAINTMVMSVLYKATPDQVKFIMVDPKMLELSLYNDIPHLLLPVVTDPKKASLALQWAVDEMERRYQLLSDSKVRDIGGFNKKLDKLRDQREAMEKMGVLDDDEAFKEAQAALDAKGFIKDPWRGQDLPESMPYIVVLIDEFADLMSVAARDVETSVQRLAQKARAAGIHVLLATQRPSTDVITGVIKNNFPSRVSFRVASRHDSSTILNSPGAENLLGMGDSLFLSVASPSPERIHGAFVSETEVERVVEFWKAQATPTYDESILQAKDEDGDGEGFGEEDRDEHYDMAVRIVTETRRASISALQRRLRVGYNRAARMIEMMEYEGIVGAPMGAKGEREVLVQAIGVDGPPKS